MPISQDDLDEAREALLAAGHDPAAYRFEYVAYPRHGCGAGLPPADIVVTHENGIRLNYPARSRWLDAFRQHVADGRFEPTQKTLENDDG